MSPLPASSWLPGISFPRVSGDEPKSFLVGTYQDPFSPRERGGAAPAEGASEESAVFPA